jgi:hypothetical protein
VVTRQALNNLEVIAYAVHRLIPDITGAGEKNIRFPGLLIWLVIDRNTAGAVMRCRLND